MFVVLSVRTTIISSLAPLSFFFTTHTFHSYQPFVSSSWKQQGAPIVGDGADDYFGTSVALSADATIMAIGAGERYDRDGKGYVKVYRTDDDGSNRAQLGQTIYGNAIDDDFGNSVDITPDGMTIVCGSPGYFGDDDRPGYVKVFFLEGDSDLGTDNWIQIGQDIIGEANYDEFGYSVSISDDGMTIAAGDPGNDGINGMDSGHVRVYRLVDNGTSWEQIGQDIDGEAAGDTSRWSVSLSADGSTVAIGAPNNGSNAPYNDNYGENSGQVAVYRIDGEGSSWERLGLSMYGKNANDGFGWSVNLSPDGNILAVGSPGYYGTTDRPGYVRVFSLEGDSDLGTEDWEQIGQGIVGDANGDKFGCSVTLSDDGKTLAVGAEYADGKNGADSGSVSVYRMDGYESSWIQLGDDIDGEDAVFWGSSVSLSADGNKVAIGSPYNDDNGDRSGHVRIYELK
jgi:hypothetical protein